MGEPLDLDPIKARINALSEHATTGDWHYDGGDEITVFPAAGGQAELVAEVWAEPGSEEERAIGEFIAHTRKDVDALLAEVDRLREVVAEVRKLHSEFKIYEPCGHSHVENDPGVVFIDDVGLVCADGYLYSVCRECCTDDGYQSEECASSHDHADNVCPTRDLVAALGERELIEADQRAALQGSCSDEAGEDL